MAWVQISEEEARNHPYWDKFCWVRWLFIIMGMLKAGLLVPITILSIYIMDLNLDKGYSIVGIFMILSVVMLLILWTVIILLFGFKRQYNKHLPFLALIYIPSILYSVAPIILIFGPETKDIATADGSIMGLMTITMFLFIYFGIYSVYKLIAENSEVFRLQYMKQIKVTQYYNNYYK
ncbi:hypothetical protein [Moraxella catarrhalis]|uniref:hypothetical protein n=1 Tax=Moraxella catarrhalis TaxID=480 RepID=UPI000EAAC7BA|nr:hypothetical protein [Moraxella catarrhalis]RKM49264.1 hypothetical protein D6D71_08450 [Moraxella catarrhalis]